MEDVIHDAIFGQEPEPLDWGQAGRVRSSQ